MKKKLIPIILIVVAIVIISIVVFSSKRTDTTTADNTNKTALENTKTNEQKNDLENTKINNQNSDSESTKIDNQDTNSQDNPVDVIENKEDDTTNEQPETNIKEEVIDYILNGQENKSDADKLNWSKSFLEQVDIAKLYDEYLTDGGKADDIEEVAKYITLNAPISDNWKELFENDLSETYGEKVSKLEPLEDDLYQAYITSDGKDVPFVVVSSRTGYYHG
ncbi:hypothetical protein SH1V18_09920 [Vallitalea longa]|uniref:Uncharacterized protein n=1 Tax=Vallitalea longa TaxID=2936439 RepID=A0A9W5Y842_9FIRM|nr:hypothetical protein [Vallitalea longa]GKX28512.1 hypothetical protein SH1V18_09920 [Vallitalea longa]